MKQTTLKGKFLSIKVENKSLLCLFNHFQFLLLFHCSSTVFIQSLIKVFIFFTEQNVASKSKQIDNRYHAKAFIQQEVYSKTWNYCMESWIWWRKQRLELTKKCFLVNRECLDFDKNNKRLIDEGTCQTLYLEISYTKEKSYITSLFVFFSNFQAIIFIFLRNYL